MNESRKLGFTRSGVECKDKLEEGCSHFNTTTDLYQTQHMADDDHHITKKQGEEDQVVMRKSSSSCKRKRRDKLDKFKGFCEAMVSKMMDKQEQLHKRLIDDMVSRDEEKIAREEAWRNQEMERITSQIEIQTKEQKSAAERQATIINFLKHFTITSDQIQNNNTTISNSCKRQEAWSPRGEAGRRWPRKEVVALVNLRCKMERGKGPLWERIAQGMMEMGYKRSGKRCKEKWENINKYFRKTKHSSKKRSLNSRTCPYFHHLTCLYNHATILAPAPHRRLIMLHFRRERDRC